MTTGGGLYRYRLHDLVKVSGFIKKCPVMQFLGREDAVTDLCGEKLHESHVREVISEQLAAGRLRPSFCLLAPESEPGRPPHYTLFIEFEPGTAEADGARLGNLSEALDAGLQANPNYRYCRERGQLTRLRVFLVEGVEARAQELFLGACEASGQRLGNIKPAFLHARRDWAGVFPGSYIEEGGAEGRSKRA